MTPLADEMATISAIKDKTSLSAYLGTTLNTEVRRTHEQRRPCLRRFGESEVYRLEPLRSSTCCRAAWECRIAMTTSTRHRKWRRYARSISRTLPQC